jgi:hypothetical protein
VYNRDSSRERRENSSAFAGRRDGPWVRGLM